MKNSYHLYFLLAIYLQATNASASQIYQGKPKVLSSDTSPQFQKLVLWNRNYEAQYMRAAIENIIALSSSQYPKAELTPSAQYEQARAFAEMANNGSVDIFVGGVDKTREKQATLILAPVDRGLLGLRVCLIADASTKFQEINSLVELREQQIIFGTGSNWPDKKVFAKAGLKTVVSPTYNNLFRMLAVGRFDCFARSVAEVKHELNRHVNEPINIEDHFLLTYPFAEFVFVSHDNRDLAERLKFGFDKAIKDKSFYRLFDKHHHATLQYLSVDKRQVIALDNKDMSVQSRQAIAKYGVGDFFKLPKETAISDSNKNIAAR